MSSPRQRQILCEFEQIKSAGRMHNQDERTFAAASIDGSQVPSLVLAYDVDATGGDIEAIAYESGDFVREQLVFGAGLTPDATREHLRRLNITFG